IKPTTEMPSTQPSTQETNDSDNPCVGQNFSKIKDAVDCLSNSGEKNVTPGGWIDGDNDGDDDDLLIRTSRSNYVLLDDGTLLKRS
ncbi:MAG TPA: hypothetical protein PKC42_03775, partial [Candidatus Nanoperiomorbaceae bacterium]|nr:hypothetical protein [Candidatus Nanoperiomorbaceae bacterium]HMQ97189.1 hypothetical protein [Candidatus Nanoperiomorbaceae bacterium]HMU12296.1 hypothetical protein [Candidatus Nanoperiomorbaceae bacterium]